MQKILLLLVWLTLLMGIILSFILHWWVFLIGWAASWMIGLAIDEIETSRHLENEN